MYVGVIIVAWDGMTALVLGAIIENRAGSWRARARRSDVDGEIRQTASGFLPLAAWLVGSLGWRYCAAARSGANRGGSAVGLFLRDPPSDGTDAYGEATDRPQRSLVGGRRRFIT